MTDFQELIQRCDTLIKGGRAHEASRLITKVNTNKTPREWRLPLAQICRRCGQVSFGLKILAKVVLNEKNMATPTELAEYAVLLQRSGALSEAMKTLDKVNPLAAPESLLYRAFIHFARWEYDLAIPSLRSYLASGLAPYAATVAQLNLAFALVEERQYPEALELLNALLQEKSPQMRSNAHSLRGQIFMQRGEFANARSEFDAANQLTATTQTNDQFFRQKWNLILDGLENKNLDAFKNLKQLALQNRSWETCREADLFSSKVHFQQEIFLHLYFGSPFEGFRKRLVEEIGHAPDRHTYILGPKSAPRFDLKSGKLEEDKVLKPGHKCHILLQSLLQDFYRPPRIASLFANIFPDEHYDITSSPHRVRQLIFRTREILNENGVAAEIAEDRGFYAVQVQNEAVSFRISLERDTKNLHALHFEKLQQVLADTPEFSATQAKERLQTSLASVHRLIQKGLQSGDIISVGKKRQTPIYRIKKSA